MKLYHGSLIESSPRMWGCFRCATVCASRGAVFPTHVGVFLWLLVPMWLLVRLPHACGGVSATSRGLSESLSSSPRMWGCFLYS